MIESFDSATAETPTREDAIAFLTGHFRYDTMNSWNNATSYAHNVNYLTLPGKI